MKANDIAFSIQGHGSVPPIVMAEFSLFLWCPARIAMPATVLAACPACELRSSKRTSTIGSSYISVSAAADDAFLDSSMSLAQRINIRARRLSNTRFAAGFTRRLLARWCRDTRVASPVGVRLGQLRTTLGVFINPAPARSAASIRQASVGATISSESSTLNA